MGIKHDQGKTPLSLIPAESLRQVADVLAFGAEKYGAHNWRAGMDHTRYASAALRHIFAYIEGEDLDPESGKEHIAHAICGLMMLLESKTKGYGTDDRHKEEN